MKLIIELEEKDYNLVYDLISGVEPKFCRDRVYKAIANGTPYNPSGDAISREQVLKELMAHQYSQDFCKEHGIEYSINSSMVRIIVNGAQAVDLWQMRQEATENALKKAEVLYGRPQGDCISREALKKAIHNSNLSGNREWLLMELDGIIDNAPTVSPFKPMCKAKDEAICEEMTTDGHCSYTKHCPNKESTTPNEQIAWEQGYEVGLAQGKQERPQGEWKTVEGIDGDEYYECSNCGEPWFLSAGTPKDNNMNFCPNCGADMRGGKE